MLCRTYHTTLRAIIPLPDPTAAPGDAAHLNAYRQFPTGSTVMALYPDTSCFYRAEVIASPQDLQPVGRVSKPCVHLRGGVRKLTFLVSRWHRNYYPHIN